MGIISYRFKDFVFNGTDNDNIFSVIRNTEDFYEIEILQKWNQYLSNVKVILDIGANIGNHSIYWSQFEDVEKILAFEPLTEIYKILERNIKENNIDKVETLNLGVGETDGSTVITRYDSVNTDTTLSYVEEENKIKFVSIDGFLSDRNFRVDLIKIEVKGSVIHALKGMELTVTEHKPIIWVKTSLDSTYGVMNFFDKQGYQIIDIYKFNILAIHKSRIDDLKPISQEKLIFDMLKNLSSSLTYRNNYIANLSAIREYENKFRIANKRNIELLEELKDSTSRFQCEQRKCENLLEELKDSTSRFEYEQRKCENLLEELKDSTSRFEYEQRKCENLLEELKKSASRFEYEQKKCKALEKQINVYKSRKIVKIVDKFLKTYKRIKK